LSAYQAEFGRTAGGGINLVTRSGGTEVHGSAFWNRRHASMNANSFFNNGYVNPAPGHQLTANFLASPTPYYRRSDTIFRVDWAATSMNIYARYGTDTRDQLVPFSVAPGLGNLVNFLPGYNWAAHITNTINPTMVNEIVIGVGHNNFGYYRPDDEPDSNYFRSSKVNAPRLRPFLQGPQYETSSRVCNSRAARFRIQESSFRLYRRAPHQQHFSDPYKNFKDTYTVQDDLTKALGPQIIPWIPDTATPTRCLAIFRPTRKAAIVWCRICISSKLKGTCRTTGA
jgi:hypothetical protein